MCEITKILPLFRQNLAKIPLFPFLGSGFYLLGGVFFFLMSRCMAVAAIRVRGRVIDSDFDSIKFQVSARKVLFFLSGYFFFFQGQREWLEDLSSLSRCCAFSSPCSAARRYHLIAVAVFFSTPLPRR